MKRRKLPIGIQSFKDIRINDYVYVDKTSYIWKLIESGKVYFLSRPRRFGKSLLISTMEAYFRGERELFHDLAIEELEDKRGDKAWQEYPVIRFSLSGGSYNLENGLSDALNAVIKNSMAQYGITNVIGETLPIQFKSLIEQIYFETRKPLVILVDEYDKPLLDTMEVNRDQEERNRQTYKSFFSVLKDEDQYLKFVFFTGVTKFSKVSIFSDLNQLNDISMDDRYAGICGITEEEFTDNFKPEIENLAKSQEQSINVCMRKLACMYDGYHFSKNGNGVYNPFSILNAFDKEDYGSYWFSTGTPTFLIHKLRESSFTPEQLSNGVEASEMELTDYEINDPNPIPLFYQSGYLTICGFNKRFRIYSLEFPNQEVKYGFLNSLVPSVLGSRETDSPVSLFNMIMDLENGNIESFLNRLKSLFASIPYSESGSEQYESEWRNQMFLIFSLLGQNAESEVHSSEGRADCIVETEKYIYVFEFKLDYSAGEALNHILNKGYADKYIADNRQKRLIGINFSKKKRNIENWIIKDKND